MKTSHRYTILILICVTCSLALTFTTYFYSYLNASYYGWAWSVNRGWPLSWAVEMHIGVFEFPLPAFYPFNFQALNFALDFVFWATVLLLPSSLYLYRESPQTVVTSRAWDGVVRMIPSRGQRQDKSRKSINNQVTLYVKGNRIKGADREVAREKTIVTQVNVMSDPYPWAAKFPYYDVERITHFDYVLSKDQQEMMENVKDLGLKYDFKVEVIDLGKMNILSRSRLRHSKEIGILPAVVTDSGEIFEGLMTKQQIETCFSKAAKAAQASMSSET